MPAASKKSYGPTVQARARHLLQVILGVVADVDRAIGIKFNADWADTTPPRLTIETTLQDLTRLTHTDLKANTPEFKRAKAQVGEALGDLRDFVQILDDHRTQKKGSDRWHFSLRLWGKDVDRNLAEFDKLWKSRKSPHSQLKPAPETQVESRLKPGAPRPRVRLPENFVARPEALDAVKGRLLRESEQTLVVSAIAGLGGLGKSVLATAIVLDPEVQGRFEDGILWVTLGQNPDLLGLIGEWIRELDKSRESFSATTLESASGYLHNLLAEKRVLLVVDDVWNAAHSEWFRVGGPGCRVLVTTREAQVEGADYYALDLMTEGEAIALVRGKLKQQWDAGQADAVRRFARVVGYLPLALDLSVNLVRDGVSWGELQAEFEDERKAVALGLLDASEAFEHLPEEKQRKYSLKACFNLSLKRLNPEQLRRFAWLGVLPEDVRVEARMVGTLWDVSAVMGKKGLIELFRRSFLTSAGESIEGYALYRVHDLMHDTARGLIENGELGVEGLAGAHGAFVDRYGALDYRKKLCGLLNDGYIHRHLTWHLVMARREDAVHELLGASDGLGRNAWFEACEEIGEPAVFVQDVKRGWGLAEEMYERDKERAIVLQGRYALLTSTMNLLTESLPPDLIAGFVHRGFWSVERAWAYVEQIQDERKIDNAISWIAPYLSKNLWQSAIQKAEQITNYCHRANAFSALLDVTDNCLDQAMELEQLMEDSLSEQDQNTNDPLYQLLELSHQKILLSLSKIKDEYFQKALKSARQNSKLVDSAASLIALSEINNYYLDEALEATELVADKVIYAHLLVDLAKIDLRYCDKAFEVVCLIKEEANLVDSLGSLINIRHNLHVEVSRVAKRIQNIFCRVRLLAHLANIEPAYLDEALATLELASKLSQLPNLESVGDSYQYTLALIFLTNLDASYFPKALDATILLPKSAWCKEIALRDLYHIKNSDSEKILSLFRLFNGSNDYASVIVRLAKVDERFFSEALDVANLVHDNCIRASLLAELAENNKACLDKALKTKRLIQNSIDRARISVFLARIEKSYFWEALEDTKSISVKDENIFSLPMNQDERRWNLISLVYVEDANFSQILEVAQLIHDEDSLAWILVAMSRIDPNYSPQAIQAIRSVQNLIDKARVLGCLAAIDSSYFSEALETAQSIQGFRRARALSDLASINNICFEEALNIAQSMQKTEGAKSIDEEEYASVLGSLAIVNNDIFQLALEATREIRFIPGRIRVINQLINNSPDNYVNHLHDIIAEIPSISDRSQAFSSYLPRLPLANLPYPDWKSHLHLLAHRKRADLMGDLVTLYPAILHLGGEGAMRGIVDEMKRVCEQWP